MTPQNANRASPSSEAAEPATSGWFSNARDVDGGVVTATPLTIVSSETTIAASGRCAVAVAVSSTPPAPATTVIRPTTRAPWTDHHSAIRPASNPKTMNPNEFSPNA
ncbi:MULTISPECIES: hypothetical protein [Rhodococcus]|uniref:hypothetical protein n=1 Tax=Rhodococcus TaxID=1827 RepID=UPI001EF04E08|nr:MULTISPECIES: hypothetical protein [Rhodococcus]